MMTFTGTYTALVTPFLADEARSIDWKALDTLVESQINGGVEGLVPCGTTGESPTLTHDEHVEVVRRVVDLASGRVKVLAGAGSPATREASRLVRAAEAAGADGVMVVVPYYNRPSQDGLFAHFCDVAMSTSKPVVVYNVPGRTGADLAPDTMSRLCDRVPNIVAIKEATGNVLRAQELKRRLGERLTVLCGDDALTPAMIACGAAGVISVTSNVLPAAVAAVTGLALAGDFAAARRQHFRLLPVHEVMFAEANPSPAKAALALQGKMQDVVRAPLVPASPHLRTVLSGILAAFDGSPL